MTVTSKRLLEAVWRDAIVIVIAVPLVVASVILYASTEPHPWMPSRRWWDLAAVTGALLWAASRAFRHYWRQRSFWLNLAWLTALHLAVWSIVLANVDEWPGGWSFMAISVEGPLFLLALYKLGYRL